MMLPSDTENALSPLSVIWTGLIVWMELVPRPAVLLDRATKPSMSPWYLDILLD